jgi:hypothetical protein
MEVHASSAGAVSPGIARVHSALQYNDATADTPQGACGNTVPPAQNKWGPLSSARGSAPVAVEEGRSTPIHTLHFDDEVPKTPPVVRRPQLSLQTPDAAVQDIAPASAGVADRQQQYRGVTSTALQDFSDVAAVTARPVKVDARPLAIVRYIRLLVRFSPEPLSSFFAKLEPIVSSWASALHFIFLTLYIFLEIILELSIEVWVALKPYKPELLLPSFAGLVMCFFGGSFVTTIAAAEAYRLVGYESTRECLKTLMEEFQQVVQAAERDAAVGVDDVEPSGDSGKQGRYTVLVVMCNVSGVYDSYVPRMYIVTTLPPGAYLSM